MRLYALLIFLAVGLAFYAGYLSLSIRNAPRTAQGSVSDIVQLKARFEHLTNPAGKVALASLFPPSEYSQLVDPAFELPQNGRYAFGEMANLFRYAQDCAGKGASRLSLSNDLALQKTWQWFKFKCRKLSRLPQGFFERAPFTSVLGGSFAFLATQTSDRLVIDPTWVKAHLPFFHVTELAKLEAQFHIESEEARSRLATLDSDSLKSVSDGDELVLGKSYVFFRQLPRDLEHASSSNLLGRPNTFFYYPRRDWDQALAQTEYRAENLQEGHLCVLKEGQVCWQIGTDEALQSIQMKTLILFLFTAVMTGVLVWISIRKFVQQKLEEERKRFALQTLTHELRTPLASLVVSSEEIMDRFDSIPSRLQGSMLRMCDDVQRLHRLAEVSKHYLGSEGDGSLIQFDFKTVPSVSALLRAVLEPFEGKVDVDLRNCDGPFTLDAYWVGVCVKNLLENALSHGQSPVRFIAEVRSSVLEISVQDAGICFKPDLGAMAQPFVKGSTSRGLGLGLSIVRKVSDTMNADLSFAANPTTFSLRIRQGQSII